MKDLSSQSFGDIAVGIVKDLSGYFLTFITGLTVLVFIWGVVKYIYKGDSEAERKKGKDLMVWGLIGLFVLFGIWGIVGVVGKTFGVETGIPQFEKSNTGSSNGNSQNNTKNGPFPFTGAS